MRKILFLGLSLAALALAPFAWAQIGPGRPSGGASTTAANTWTATQTFNLPIASGTANVGFGTSSGALPVVTTGTQNVGVGVSALLGVTSGSGNIGVGRNTMKAIAGNSNNIGVGDQAGAGAGPWTGDGNICIGASTALNVNGAATNNIYIGTSAGPSGFSSGSNNICIGASCDLPAAGTASNQAVFGNASTTATYLRGTVQVPTLQTTASVSPDGGGMKHKRVAGCTTAASAGASCATTITWTTPFADANYTVVCGGDGVASGGPVNGGVGISHTASAVTFQTVAVTAVAAAYTTIDCIATHD